MPKMTSYKPCQDRAGSAGSSCSTDTNTSDQSKSTAPTVLSDQIPAKKWADWPEVEVAEPEPEIEVVEDEMHDHHETTNPRDSTSTYASTTNSITEDRPEPRYEVLDRKEDFPTDAFASTPSSFAGLFPSSRRLLIRHDDATIDGNMNLRVDTVVPTRSGCQQDVILFHLRMYDLFSRKFSLRRYCRDSGREVCHSSRKKVSSSLDRRPGLRRSWNSVLASFRPGSSHTSSGVGLKRTDSGFEANRRRRDSIFARYGFDESSNGESSSSSEPSLTDTILMEFSNYAHVEMKRRGASSTKRYEYEYWSTKYQWRCEARQEGDLREVSYHLVDMRTSRTIAHLVPDILTPLEAIEERSKGGWVPPSSIWITDPSAYERMPDVAE